jgi:hypothetical protein
MIRVNYVTDSIKPICLPLGADQTRNLDGQNVIVSGWGTTEKGDVRNQTGTLFITELNLRQCIIVYLLQTWDRRDMHERFWLGNLEGRHYLENIGLAGGDNLKMDIKEIRWDGVDWIHLAQNREQWSAAVHMVINL